MTSCVPTCLVWFMEVGTLFVVLCICGCSFSWQFVKYTLRKSRVRVWSDLTKGPFTQTKNCQMYKCSATYFCYLLQELFQITTEKTGEDKFKASIHRSYTIGDIQWWSFSQMFCSVAQGCQMVYFQTKKSQFGSFLGVCKGRGWYNFMAIWPIFRTFGIFYGHLVYFMAICYICWLFGIFPPVLVITTEKNLATLAYQRMPRLWFDE
jgi:hypothetical protein